MNATQIIIEAINYNEGMIKELDHGLNKAIEKYNSDRNLDDLFNAKRHYNDNIMKHRPVLYELNRILVSFGKNKIM